MFERTAVISAHRLPELQQAIAKLAKRAARIGVPAPTVTVGGAGEPHWVCTNPEEAAMFNLPRAQQRGYYVPTVAVTVTGDQPRFDGWQLRGTVTPLGDGYLVNRAPLAGEGDDPEPLPERFRTAGMVCDHCNKVRSRGKAVILSHVDGRWAQVGTTCIAAFLPGTTPDQLLSIAEAFCALQLGGDDEGYWGCGSRERVFGTEDFLAVACACIRTRGYVPGSFEGLTTKGETFARISGDIVRGSHVTPADRDEQAAILALSLTPEVAAEVAAAREWAASLDTGGNDYLHNLQLSVGADYVTFRSGGYACSVFAAHQRAVEGKREREAQLPSRHLGAVKERITVTGCNVVYTRLQDGDYGVSTMVKFVAPDGARLTWWATGDHADLQGKVVDLVGTVKGHTVYKDQPETTVTRCRVTEVAPVAEVAA